MLYNLEYIFEVEDSVDDSIASWNLFQVFKR